MALISLNEYAEKHGRKPDTVRQKVLRGGFKTAEKHGRDWLIDEDEPYVDERKKTTENNKTIDYRIGQIYAIAEQQFEDSKSLRFTANKFKLSCQNPKKALADCIKLLAANKKLTADIDARIGEIINNIDFEEFLALPQIANNERQGAFIVGYWQEKNITYHK